MFGDSKSLTSLHDAPPNKLGREVGELPFSRCDLQSDTCNDFGFALGFFSAFEYCFVSIFFDFEFILVTGNCRSGVSEDLRLVFIEGTGHDTAFDALGSSHSATFLLLGVFD